MIEKTHPQLTKTPWMDFLDDAGWHLCQPDGVLETDDGIFVIEIKLRQNWQGYEELRHLYMPILSHYHDRPVKGMVVCGTLQSKMQSWMFLGPQARISDLPDGSIGTWLLRA